MFDIALVLSVAIICATYYAFAKLKFQFSDDRRCLEIKIENLRSEVNSLRAKFSEFDFEEQKKEIAALRSKMNALALRYGMDLK